MSDDLSIPNTGYRGNRAGRYGTGQSRVQQGMDPDTRRLMMFAGGLGVVLVALIAASAMVGRHGNEVPVVTADLRPVREKPVNPGGMKIDGAENDLFSSGSDMHGAKLAPVSETPDTNRLQTTAVPSPAAAPVLEAPTPTPTAAASAPVPVLPVPVNKPSVAASVSPDGLAVVRPTPVKPPGAAVESHPAASAHQPPATPAHPLSAASVHQLPAASAHQAIVQFAALSSAEAARNEWEQLSRRMPDMLNGRQPNYSQTERDGHIYWRVRTAGFTDVAQARDFCDRVRAKGGTCSVADY